MIQQSERELKFYKFLNNINLHLEKKTTTTKKQKETHLNWPISFK